MLRPADAADATPPPTPALFLPTDYSSNISGIGKWEFGREGGWEYCEPKIILIIIANLILSLNIVKHHLKITISPYRRVKKLFLASSYNSDLVI